VDAILNEARPNLPVRRSPVKRTARHRMDALASSFAFVIALARC
jgi:hypothetical protein